MQKLQRAHILDLDSYERIRADVRAAIIDVQRPRRVSVGTQLVFMFENIRTVWYQVQEMLRAERIDQEAAIQREVDTYNARLGGSGQLGCCLLVAIDDATVRERRLREWLALPAHVYLRCAGGATVRATFDRAQGRRASHRRRAVSALPRRRLAADRDRLRSCPGWRRRRR